VQIDGQLAPILGRVSMDLLAIDLGRVPTARVGSKVTLWGPELPVEQVASAAGTIGYDLICGVTRRVLFVDDDEGPGPRAQGPA
jgi:alanine racemase